jgi:hypothetical protein
MPVPVLGNWLKSGDATHFQSVDCPHPGVPNAIDRHFQLVANRIKGFLQSMIGAKQFNELKTDVVVPAASFPEQVSLGFWVLFRPALQLQVANNGIHGPRRKRFSFNSAVQ